MTKRVVGPVKPVSPCTSMTSNQLGRDFLFFFSLRRDEVSEVSGEASVIFCRLLADRENNNNNSMDLMGLSQNGGGD